MLRYGSLNLRTIAGFVSCICILLCAFVCALISSTSFNLKQQGWNGVIINHVPFALGATVGLASTPLF